MLKIDCYITLTANRGFSIIVDEMLFNRTPALLEMTDNQVIRLGMLTVVDMLERCSFSGPEVVIHIDKPYDYDADLETAIGILGEMVPGLVILKEGNDGQRNKQSGR